MKCIIKLIILVFLLLPLLLKAQVGKICNWKDDKKAAVALSFDDWSPGQYPIVVPELNVRGLKATFFIETSLVASWNHDWPDVITTANAGHEIGNHTVNHPNLTGQTASNLNNEITGAKTLIDSKIVNQKAISFAYPLGAYNTTVVDTIKKSGHILARTVLPPSGVYYTYNFATTADDYFYLRTFPMDGTIKTSAFSTQIQNVIAGGGLLTFLYHSIDNATGTYGDNWWAKVVQDSLQKQLDVVVAQKNNIWSTTFGNSVKYHKEKRCASLSEVQAPNGTTWIVNLTDTLSNNSIYNHPITLKLKMNSVAYSSVVQNGNTLTSVIIGDTIMFDAIPDGGQIALSTTVLPVNLTPTLNALSSVSISQLAGTQTVNLSGISAGASETQTLTVTAVTYNTNLIKNLAVTYTSPNTIGSISFNPNAALSGSTTIVVRVTDNGTPANYVEQSFTVSVSAVSTAIHHEIVIADNELIISPNPSIDIVSITSEKVITSASVSLEDASGSIVYKEYFPSFDSTQLDLSSKKSGIYFLRIKSEQGTIVKKIIVL